MDKALADNAKDALQSAQGYQYPDVKVSAYRGAVQLSGFVATEDQKNKATDIARRVPGVRRVVNDLMLESTAISRPSARAIRQDRTRSSYPDLEPFIVRRA